MDTHSTQSFDVIIVGAGAAGLIAALELTLTGKSVAILEAKDRIGGRIFTINDPLFESPVEAGAEFVHGNLELTLDLLKKAAVKTTKIKGNFWQKDKEHLKEQENFIEDYSDLEKKFKELKTDLSVANFISEHLAGDKYEELRFTLKNYVEGYYAANTNKASTFSLCEELKSGDEEQYRIEGGYIELVNHLHRYSVDKGALFFLSSPVKTINWKKGNVEVITENEIFRAKKLLLTVSLGVLQSRQIGFSPAITSKMEAVQQLGFGSVIKIIIQFKDAFWKEKEITEDKDLSKMAFLFSDEAVPTWWTQNPKQVNILTGWLGGPNAERMKDLSSEEITEKALESLSRIFRLEISFLKLKIIKVMNFNWTLDPFTCGGYAYEVVNGEKFRTELKSSIEETIFFAGEGLHGGAQIGTVEGALVSGRETAHQMIATFN